VQDDNLRAAPVFTIEGGIGVYAPVSAIGTSNARITADSTRRNPNFSNVLVHRSIGEAKSFQGILQLRGRTRLGEMYATYTYDRTSDNGSISCCTTGTMFGTSRAYGDPNNYDDQWGPSNENRKHTFVIAPQFDLPYGFKASAIFRTFSGLPYTPRYQADVNGDGRDNDRIYVPTAAEVSSYLMGAAGSSPAALQEQSRQRGLLEQKIAQTECLRENRGKVIARNACRSPWQNVLDARVSKQFNTMRGQNVELVADFFNVLNGLNSEWGRRRQVSFNDERFLNPIGFDATAQRFRYTVNESFARITPSDNFQLAQFQMQLGARYNF
jgi:hypothetical protein